MRMAAQLPWTSRSCAAPLGTTTITALPLRASTLSLGSRLQMAMHDPHSHNSSWKLGYSTMKRSLLFALTAAVMAAGFSTGATAAVATPALGAAANGETAVATKVKWVCGPYRCAWIPGWRGRRYVVPRMRNWGPPPHPLCYYQRGPFGGWVRVCP